EKADRVCAQYSPSPCSPEYSKADNPTDKVPALAVELHHLKLLDRMVVGRARVDAHTRKKQRKLDVVHVSCDAHYVLTGQVIAAAAQNILECLRHAVCDAEREQHAGTHNN